MPDKDSKKSATPDYRLFQLSPCWQGWKQPGKTLHGTGEIISSGAIAGVGAKKVPLFQPRTTNRGSFSAFSMATMRCSISLETADGAILANEDQLSKRPNHHFDQADVASCLLPVLVVAAVRHDHPSCCRCFCLILPSRPSPIQPARFGPVRPRLHSICLPNPGPTLPQTIMEAEQTSIVEENELPEGLCSTCLMLSVSVTTTSGGKSAASQVLETIG